MFKKRFISILALLCLTVSGAWAQEVTLLTTIESTGDNASFTSGSKTFDNIATVTFSGNVENYGDEQGWFCDEERTLTVTAAEGYTITRVKFYNDSGSAFDEGAPFEAILAYDDEIGYIAKVNGTSIGTWGTWGVTKIEVYGYADTPAPATVAVTGVTLAPTSATLTLGETETVTLIPTVLPDDATDKSVAWSSSNEAVATVSNDGVVTAVAAGTATITVTTTDGAKTATCAVTVAAPAASTYTVTLKEGTEDATSWTIAPAEATTTGVAAGTEVKATYGGTKRVKSVKAKKKANIVNLSTLEGDYVAQNGDVLTGTLEGSEKPYKISIADGATVTLDNATINGVAGYASDPMMAEWGMYDGFYQWCGLTCEGDATIILKDGTENAVKGFYLEYPGIYVPENKTLTIKGGAAGTGKLTAQNGTEGKRSGTGAGIGAGYNLSCGHINIQGGEITATGQGDSAGIGGADCGDCGNITISGGKINATGGGNGAGIGGGAFMSCGDITIESTVISVTATSGGSSACSIGKGYDGSCGTVTIGGTVYADGVATSPFTYPTAP